MRLSILIPLLATLTLVHPAAAQPATAQPAAAPPATQPATRPARGDTVQCSGIVNAPAAEIYASFTTGDGIVKAWSVAKAKVDFRIGGQIRTSYQPDTDLDSDKAIVNTILAFEPNRMLAMKATAPAGSPDWLQAICETGFAVIRLDEIAPDRTRVTITGMGYGQGDLFDKAHSFFDQGNRATLKLMQQKFDRSNPDDAQRIVQLFRNCIGGVWIMQEQLPDGKTLCGKVVFEDAFDGKFVLARGALGGQPPLRDHAILSVGTDPVIGKVFFDQLMDTGAHANGVLCLGEDGKSVSGVWAFHGPQGVTPWHIRYDFVDTDHYQVRMWRGQTPAAPPTMTLNYRRQPQAPAGW